MHAAHAAHRNKGTLANAGKDCSAIFIFQTKNLTWKASTLLQHEEVIFFSFWD